MKNLPIIIRHRPKTIDGFWGNQTTVNLVKAYAEKSEATEVVQLNLSETEMLKVIEQVLEDKETKPEANECLKIYNQNRQLVYETRDKEDERLVILLRRSDLIWRNDSSSYYLLGN